MDYKNLAEQFDKTHTVNQRIISELVSHFGLHKAVNVLDFGCGSGNYIYKLRHITDYRIYGVDPCDEMIDIAIRKNPDSEIIKGNHKHIPFPDKYFDYVYMTNVVHHVKDLSLMYREIGRVLKDDGIVCICTESYPQLLGKYWIRFFPSISIIDTVRFHSILKLTKKASTSDFYVLRITKYTERRKTRISPFILNQIKKRSMSVLQLVSNREYTAGKKRIIQDYNNKKVFMSYRGYTFVWLKKKSR